jgi:hypothetical protein
VKPIFPGLRRPGEPTEVCYMVWSQERGRLRETPDYGAILRTRSVNSDAGRDVWYSTTTAALMAADKLVHSTRPPTIIRVICIGLGAEVEARTS